MITKLKPRPRAKKQEIAEAFAYAREHDVYKHVAPANDNLKLDIVMLHVIDEEVARRREAFDKEAKERKEAGKPPKREPNLAYVVGTAIRDLFGYKKTRRRKLSPEEEARAREIEGLIKAYEGLMMKIFAMRKAHQKSQLAAKKSKIAETSHPVHRGGQIRLT